MGVRADGRLVVGHRGMGPGQCPRPDFGPNKGKPRKSANFRVFLDFFESDRVLLESDPV